jgi:hypothetical protein
MIHACMSVITHVDVDYAEEYYFFRVSFYSFDCRSTAQLLAEGFFFHNAHVYCHVQEHWCARFVTV